MFRGQWRIIDPESNFGGRYHAWSDYQTNVKELKALIGDICILKTHQHRYDLRILDTESGEVVWVYNDPEIPLVARLNHEPNEVTAGAPEPKLTATSLLLGDNGSNLASVLGEAVVQKASDGLLFPGVTGYTFRYYGTVTVRTDANLRVLSAEAVADDAADEDSIALEVDGQQLTPYQYEEELRRLLGAGEELSDEEYDERHEQRFGLGAYVEDMLYELMPLGEERVIDGPITIGYTDRRWIPSWVKEKLGIS